MTQLGEESKALNLYYLSSCWSAFSVGEKKMHARTAEGDFILPMMREAMNTIIADNTHLTARCEAMLEALNSDVAKSLEPTFDELNPPPEPRKEYRYHLGDTVYIGTQEYELLSFDEKKVVLFDTQFPLFNKELSREEFDNRLKENPLNDKLLQVVEEPPVADNTKAKISLDTGSNKVHWIYFNPNADADGQYVSGDLDFSVFEELVEQYDIASHPENAAGFRNDLEEMSDQFLADINTPFFMEAENDYEMDCDYIEFTPENILKIHGDILSLEADREAARETDRYEAEFGADGTRVFRETEDLAEDDSGIESLTDEELDDLPISTVKEGEVVTYPNAEALLDDQEETLAPPPQVKRPTKIVPHVLHPEIDTEYRTNFQIESDDIGVGTPLERFYHNIRAIQLLNKLDAENRLATPTEQRVLADYVGWGGLSEFFKEENPHYTELKNVLSDEEYASARESTLTAFYTPPVVIKAVYRALENMHFQTGNVLEPSCGIGNFMGLAPESMNTANSETQKKELFGKVRSGQVRVLIGSTQKMGAGTNVQTKLAALHHLDCPWRPSDLQQREGRIIRQGNENKEVDIYTYVTENTFDSYLYQLVESKQKFIGQIMTSKSPVRSAEDIDETALSYAEIKALCAGDPHIKEKMDLDIDVSRLKLLKANHLSQRYALEDQIIKEFPQKIRSLEQRIEGYQTDIDQRKRNTEPNEDGFSPMIMPGGTVREKKAAGDAILGLCKSMTSPDPIPIGQYRGFDMELSFDTFSREYKITLIHQLRHTVTLGTDIFGNIQRLDNTLGVFEERMAACVEQLENTRVQLENAKAEVQKPFPQEEELKTKSARLNELNAMLNLDKRENEIVDGERGEEEPSRSSDDRER